MRDQLAFTVLMQRAEEFIFLSLNTKSHSSIVIAIRFIPVQPQSQHNVVRF